MEINKNCVRCGALKSLEEFYKKDKSCKDCRKAKIKNYRALNMEKIRSYDRARGQAEERKQKNKDYQAYMKKNEPEKWLIMRCEAVKKNRAKNRNKYIANSKVRYAISTKKIKQEPCIKCGAQKSEAHHPDYSKPLEVVWLCDYHHKEEHKKLRALQRGY
jgi:site-specific recombinase XerD